jgi:hypothetical protein
MTRKRAIMLVAIMAASFVTSTSALAEGGDECMVACRWYDLGCIISQIAAGC